jgi:uncharacterized membrane protein
MPQLYTVIIAALPISELRGAIPLAVGVYKLPVIEAYFWAVLGNMIPIFFLLWFWPTLAQILMRRFKFFDKLFNWVFERTKRRTDKKFQRYGQAALVILVAIPLPITGAWTGSVAAFLFGIPYWRSLGLIFVGVLIAGIIVTLLTSTGITLLNFI